MSVKPASRNGATAATIPPMSPPHGMDAATSSSVTKCEAAAKAAVPGSSALTFHPPANQRNWSCARRTAVSRSVSQQIGIWPILRVSDDGHSASHCCTNVSSGSTAIIASARGAPSSIDRGPDTAIAIGTRRSGRSQSFAESTRKCLPA